MKIIIIGTLSLLCIVLLIIYSSIKLIGEENLPNISGYKITNNMADGVMNKGGQFAKEIEGVAIKVGSGSSVEMHNTTFNNVGAVFKDDRMTIKYEGEKIHIITADNCQNIFMKSNTDFIIDCEENNGNK